MFTYFATYQEALQQPQWQLRRRGIIKRDHCKCTSCGKAESLSYYDHRLKCQVHLQPSGIIKVSSFYDIEGNRFHRNETELVQTSHATSLHVHHKYYVEETHPWDYPDTALITLCASCHLELHKRTKVKVFKDKSLSVEMPYDSCNRCHGAGSFPQFKHVENGTCFKCRGARFMRSKVVSFTF